MTPNPKILEFLVCPVTKAGLRYDEEKGELLSDRAKLAYPIINGVPNMVVDNARAMTSKEIKK
jgi:uncharacterized protein YbaR (Trm112 family)